LGFYPALHPACLVLKKLASQLIGSGDDYRFMIVEVEATNSPSVAHPIKNKEPILQFKVFVYLSLNFIFHFAIPFSYFHDILAIIPMRFHLFKDKPHQSTSSPSCHVPFLLSTASPMHPCVIPTFTVFPACLAHPTAPSRSSSLTRIRASTSTS
jgi:hypothetical protein